MTENRERDWRLMIVFGVVFLSASVILARLFFVQVSLRDQYREKAQYQYSGVVDSRYRRGDIFFTDKAGRLVPVSTARPAYTVVVDPTGVEDAEKLFLRLSEVVELDRDEFFGIVHDKRWTRRVLLRNLEEEAGDEIAALRLPGVNVWVDTVRAYPHAIFASHVLGFVGFEGERRVGQYGVEKQYERVLTGAEEIRPKNANESALWGVGRKLFTGGEEEVDIVLTLDPNVQSVAEAAVSSLWEEWGAEHAGVLIMDPRTGAIQAMAARPAFDPGRYNTEEDYAVFLNPFVEQVFEMGSVIKPLTLAAALDAGAVTESSTFYDAGSVAVGNTVIENYDGQGRGRQTMLDILKYSINTGAVFLGRELGRERFVSYFEQFGFGEVTGIDLPNEVRGNITNVSRGGPVELATASFGQGISATPLGLAVALSAIANGGELVEPFVVRQFLQNGEVVEEHTPSLRRRVLREETAEVVSRMLADVVDTLLGGGKAKISGYHIAAKTGTAQIPAKDGLGYSEDALHTFFGYAPAFDPAFLIFLYVERPQGARFASQTLTEPFHDLAEFLIQYYEIPPDREITNNQ